jgi:hypothetical protein
MTSNGMTSNHVPRCDTCCACGRDVPEGWFVCPECEHKYSLSDGVIIARLRPIGLLRRILRKLKGIK